MWNMNSRLKKPKKKKFVNSRQIFCPRGARGGAPRASKSAASDRFAARRAKRGKPERGGKVHTLFSRGLMRDDSKRKGNTYHADGDSVEYDLVDEDEEEDDDDADEGDSEADEEAEDEAEDYDEEEEYEEEEEDA